MPIVNTYRCIECYTQNQIEVATLGSSTIEYDLDSEELAITHLQENLDHFVVAQSRWIEESE